jgi:hypothetical protein
MKSKTLKKKQKENPNGPKGKSKYAAKVEKRREIAKEQGVDDMPLPLLRETWNI